MRTPALLTVAVVVLAGCRNGETDNVTLSSTAVTVTNASDPRPAGDDPAAARFQRVRASFAVGKPGSEQFHIYEIAPVTGLVEQIGVRASAVGLKDVVVERQQDAISARSGAKVLRIDLRSGSEFFADMSRFHRGAGAKALPLSEADYIARAARHVSTALAVNAEEHGLYPYKVRHYVNDAMGPDGKSVGETIYQVAVAFNGALDGIPVIGAGGKAVVHLGPDGSVVSHESTLRKAVRRIATVSLEDLLAPDDAQRMIETRLTARGVHLEDYALTRAEFGYLRLGRNSIQTIVAPHYAFFFEPISTDIVGKKLVETVPAVADTSILELLKRDEAAELARKAELESQASPPDSR